MSNLAMMMGLGSGAGGVAVADVFSTDLWTGTGAENSITNGLDLSGEGGLVWIKRKDSTDWHRLFDTINGATNYLRSNASEPLTTYSEELKVFNDDGFTLGTSGGVNGNNQPFVGWSWRVAPKWFDIVEYTGTGAAQTISHSLGSEVGMILIKQTSSGNTDWSVYHRSLGGTKSMRLDDNTQEAINIGYFNDTDATSTEFTVGYLGDFNSAGKTYIAYVFAHNESLIQCGSYETNSSNTFGSVDLGWQPQFLMVKAATTSSDWFIFDAERGMSSSGNSDYLEANTTNATANDDSIYTTSTGFTDGPGYNLRQSNHTYIYMAIKAED